MRLLKTAQSSENGPLELAEIWNDQEIPPYAILSHTWSSNPHDEVLFRDVDQESARKKAGFTKVFHAMKQAREDGYEYIWIDTCCIDKSSSAELSEAINSMYRYYQEAQVCYAFLADVSHDHDFDKSFEKSRWWKRGWTLQELLAPMKVVFYAQNWEKIGTSDGDLCEQVARIAGIESIYLRQNDKIAVQTASVSRRMSWASRRETSRSEDIAYCLLGLFSVNMPLLYGEGQTKAFWRLQDEIMKAYDDHTIFAWKDPKLGDDEPHGLLADHPSAFQETGHIIPYPEFEDREPYALTNRGLRIHLPLTYQSRDAYTATIACMSNTSPGDGLLGITLKHFMFKNGGKQFARIQCSTISLGRRAPVQQLYVVQMISRSLSTVSSPETYFRFNALPEGYQLKQVRYDSDSKLGARLRHYPPATWRAPADLPTVFRMIQVPNAVTAVVVLEQKRWGSVAFMLGCSPDIKRAVSVIPWPRELDYTPSESIHLWFNPVEPGEWMSVQLHGKRRGVRISVEDTTGYGSRLHDFTVDIIEKPPQESKVVEMPPGLETSLQKFGGKIGKVFQRDKTQE